MIFNAPIQGNAAPMMARQSRIALLALILFALPDTGKEGVAAQEPGAVAAVRDTTTAPDSLRITARGALLRSFAVPGWGQAYAGSPGRGALYFAMEAGSAWMVYKSHQQLSASRARDRWLRGRGELPADRITSLTETRAQQFEDWMTLAVFVALFSGADAYVTAQLADFDDHIGIRRGEAGALELRAAVPLPARR